MMRSWILVLALLAGCASVERRKPLVLMTDFGVKDGAVSAMKGVALGVESRLPLADLTHEIAPYNIWEGAFRLQQTFKHYPAGTVFVMVVDPGVGSQRKSIVALSNSGHYFIGPDNGLLTLVEDDVGLKEVRELDTAAYRRKGSEESYTFHGRDLYAFVGAQLAAGQLVFRGLGKSLPVTQLVRIPYQKPSVSTAGIKGTITVLDSNYGNVWTNIPRDLVLKNYPNLRRFKVRIDHKGKKVFEGVLPLVETFASVQPGKPLLYFNSLLKLSVALNQADFASRHRVGSGPEWTFTLML